MTTVKWYRNNAGQDWDGRHYHCRYYTMKRNQSANPLSILSLKRKFVIIDDPDGDRIFDYDPDDVLAGPFPSLKAAKVAYLLMSSAKGYM